MNPFHIARNNGTTVNNLRQINHLSKNSVNYGSYLKVPASSRTSAIKEFSKPSKAKSSGGQVYVVKKGDTFFNVSKRFAVSRSNIAAWNGISPNGNLKLGQRLVIKGGYSRSHLHHQPALSAIQSKRRFINAAFQKIWRFFERSAEIESTSWKRYPSGSKHQNSCCKFWQSNLGLKAIAFLFEDHN